MNSTATALPLLSEKTCLEPARVVEDERDDGVARVRLDKPGPRSIISASIAVPRSAPLAAGDRVLIAGDPSQELFVIGRIGTFRPEPQSSTVLRTNNGACAVIADYGKESRFLQILSPRRELIFEYDPVGKKARVNIAQGSLELITEDGDIELKSARAVRIGGQTIQMNSHKLDVRAVSARWIIDRLETLAGTLVEKARNTYRTVEKLAQLRTGRMRTLVDQTFHFKSRKAFLKSEEDFKIKGEKIHLG